MITLPRWRLASAAACLASLVGIPARAQAQVSTYEQLQSFSSVLSQVRANYVDSVNVGSLVRAAIVGMLRSLDPHSRYQAREDFELEARFDAGQLAAVGLSVEDADGAPVVLNVVPGGAAARAGILPGDRVRAMNDSAVAGLGARTLALRLLGERGTRVRLTLERGPRWEPDTFVVTLKRAIIEHHVVSPPRLVEPGTAYIRLAEFTPPAAKELRDALERLRGMGAKRLILDLRGNPGGSIAAMIEIAQEFLPAHTSVFRTAGRKKSGVDSVVTAQAGDFVTLPLIVLVDEGSASASEMLTGTLQDHDRALVVGRRTFGKALMQTALPLPGGDVVWLTTARVITPSGRLIQRSYQGIAAEQYYSLAGRTGLASDTLTVYHTDHGRPVRGGGGIRPDVERPAASFPVWFPVALDSGFVEAVADSVAAVLPANKEARVAWLDESARWDRDLVTPFLARVRTRVAVRAEPDTALRARLGRALASRAAEVRWGPDGAEEFLLHNDPDIRAAIAAFPALPQSLGR
jgi:carboxyl-terminal processing protease